MSEIVEKRRAAAEACMQWRMDCAGDWPMEKAQQALDCIADEHSGDCTRQPWTCMRCEAEMAFKQADQILAALTPSEREG